MGAAIGTLSIHVFTVSDRIAISSILVAHFFRLMMTQLFPGQYQLWILISGIGSTLCFLLLGIRLAQFFLQPRIDGKIQDPSKKSGNHDPVPTKKQIASLARSDQELLASPYPSFFLVFEPVVIATEHLQVFGIMTALSP